MIWNKQKECIPRSQMKEWQNKKLKETVNTVYHNVPYYRKKMQKKNIKPADITGLSDLKKLPFTTKEDLRNNYPYNLFAVPLSQIIRVHASSGTTGKPTVVGYTREDIATWSEVVARTLHCAAIGKDDFIQIAYGYGLFTGGLGIHYGSEKAGSTVIPVSGGNTAKQIQLLKDFGSTAIACTPSYALYLAEALQKEGINPADLELEIGILGAEPWTDSMRSEIEKKLQIKAYDIYGLSEIIGPGVASECHEQQGLHINEDHFLPEIIDPETKEVLTEGDKGELVFSTITKKGLPLLRYRTKDLTHLNYNKCACGRTLVRMEKCLGRSDDMLIIRGVNVFPSQIESVLLKMSETKPHYQLIVDRENNLDILEVQVEVKNYFFSDEIKELEKLKSRIKKNLENTLGLSAKIKLVEPQTLKRSTGKSQRVIDRRELK